MAKKDYLLPKYWDNASGDEEYLRDLVVEGACERYGEDWSDELANRIDYELRYIEDSGYADYFLIVADYVQHAREIGRVSPGRGSAAGSIVNYCLGITSIDPLKFGLLFERFCNPDKRLLPDIDIDVDMATQGKMFDYLSEHYDHVAYGREETHPIFICSQNIVDIVSVEKKGVRNRPTIAVSMLDAEDAGLIPFHLLRTEALSVIDLCLTMVDGNFDLDNLPLNDKTTMNLFRQGDTCGIYDFDSSTMQDLLRQAAPQTFEELVALYTMCRPGPLDWTTEYIARKNGDKPIEYVIPELREILGYTYGMTIYQEQIMLIAQRLASFTPGESDQLRRDLGKKKYDSFVVLKDKFIAQGTRNGFPTDALRGIFEEWEHTTCYTFIRSHAVCYTFLAYQIGYLKVHFPKEFATAYKTMELASAMSNYSNYSDE